MLVALSPEDWLERLGRQLQLRWPQVQKWRRYYKGDQDLPSGPSQHSETFLRFARFARLNLCGLAVSSMVARTSVDGVRTGREDLDARVWAWWQAARLDARQLAVYRKALSESAAYVFWSPGKNPDRPRITIEGPVNAITETDAADRTVTLAGLRCWYDRINKRWMATVLMPGYRVYFAQVQTTPDPQMAQVDMFDRKRWQRVNAGASGTPIDLTPESPDEPQVRAFLNGDELDEPAAEFDVGIDTQDRLNLTLLNRLSSERYAAFRQRWAINLELEDDPVTGLPLSPFKPGTDQVWVGAPPEPGQPPVQFGDFAQTMTADMLAGCTADMRAFAAITETPVYYLPGDLVNIGADAIAALDAGHNSKIKAREGVWGEDWEAVMSGVAAMAGVKDDLSAMEMIWRKPENYSPTVLGAYGQNLKAIGYPVPVIAERMGDTPQQIDQLRTEIATQAAIDAFTAPIQPPGPPPNPNQPSANAPAANADRGVPA